MDIGLDLTKSVKGCLRAVVGGEQWITPNVSYTRCRHASANIHDLSKHVTVLYGLLTAVAIAAAAAAAVTGTGTAVSWGDVRLGRAAIVQPTLWVTYFRRSYRALRDTYCVYGLSNFCGLSRAYRLSFKNSLSSIFDFIRAVD